MLGPQEQAADGGRSEFLMMREPVETWVEKQCGEGLPSSQLLASSDRKGESCSLEPVGSSHWPLAQPCSCLTCTFLNVHHSVGKTNCLPEELPMPLTAMPERAPANMPHQPKEVHGPLPSNSSLALDRELSVWLDLRHCPCGLLPCQCVY